MVATRDKHRAIVSAHLDANETLHALINVGDGSPGAGSTGAVRSSSAYRVAHGIRERGLNGHPVVGELWLALTDVRLLVFSGSWFTFTHKPKDLLTTVPREHVRLAWREQKSVRPFRLLHFTFTEGQEIVRMGEADDESDRFLTALGPDCAPLPPD